MQSQPKLKVIFQKSSQYSLLKKKNNVEILSSFTISKMNHYSIIIKTEWFLYREEHYRQKYSKCVCTHI